MSQAVVRSVEQGYPNQGETLLVELQSAYEILFACVNELDGVLDRSVPDLARLTTVRLKLAKLRLDRGPLMAKISTFLTGKVTAAEEKLLQQLRSTHQRLLELALAHTGTWSLQAIQANWPGYRRETRELTRRWLAKAKVEQQLLYPLLRKHV